MNRYIVILLSIVFLIAGCNGEPESLPPEVKAKRDAMKAAREAHAAKAAKKKEDAKKARENHKRRVVKTETAHVGVGVKGGYGGGIISTPISAYFRGQEQITFRINLVRGMKDFRMFHDNHNPKDWEEFEKEVIKKYNIDLPELRTGEEYSYDPKTGELMVETWE